MSRRIGTIGLGGSDRAMTLLYLVCRVQDMGSNFALQYAPGAARNQE